MTDFPAMIYKNSRSKTFIANCMAKNLIGFGKNEQDAIQNLMDSLQSIEGNSDIHVIPVYGLPMAQ